ncbi:MAG: tRNA threonylcarbamoyladenosine dehydratase [Deltaproteobacteria bacterium]|nr:tRNA threonylcarbamoyladenosine dehydratase [Deltaproteobacteria bacterium]
MPEDSLPSTNKPARIFDRAVELLGPEGFARLQGARVVVVGLGGVGSHTVSALARAGVGTLRLVDFDRVSWTSLGRMALALPQDVGRPKVLALAERAKAFTPELVVEAEEAFFHNDTADALLANVDLVVDAIDAVNPKVALLRSCVERKLLVVSSMGAAGRRDPSALQVGDISETTRCPLARVVRKRLRRQGVSAGVSCIWSVEEPVEPLPPDLEEVTLDRGRTRNRLPNLQALPGIFGYAVASLAIDALVALVEG